MYSVERVRFIVLSLLLCLALAPLSHSQTSDVQLKAIENGIEKAVAYLAAETPKWRTEHRCASCHHQGSAASALLTARAKGKLKDNKPLENSLEWLEHPEKWADNHGDPNASDPVLAEIQFGATLLRAEKQNSERFRIAMLQLVKQLAKRQTKKGGFALENSDGLGSPITLGPVLLTAYGRDVLAASIRTTKGDQQADIEQAVKLADSWLVRYKPRNTFEASSLLIALMHGKESNGDKAVSRDVARKIVLESPHAGGGFGPYANSPAEVFDTALAILALSRDERVKDHRSVIENAKKQLIKWQLEDGSWEETTRPSGSISYAHRISTTAWALEALLE